MLSHSFGLMQRAPLPGERYEAYEPEKYGCIEVADDEMEPVLAAFRDAACCWHALNRVKMDWRTAA